MPNLYGSNWIRQAPKFTHKQVDALKELSVIWSSDRKLAEKLDNYGFWTGTLAVLNKKSLSDILFTLSTGSYELAVDDYEMFLMEKAEYWCNINKDKQTAYERALTEYREFKEFKESQQ